LFAALALAIAASTAQAAPYVPIPPYHVDEGYFGSVTFKASGSCGFRAVTYKNAWLGKIRDSTSSPIDPANPEGRGIITASGELLVLEEDYAPIKYSENEDIGVGKYIRYTDMVGAELLAFVQDAAKCSVQSIVPNANSRASIKWDVFANKDRLNLRANFKGFETEVCSGPPSRQQCHADSFSGSIVFQGNRATPG
jgi:hypothetical protein